MNAIAQLIWAIFCVGGSVYLYSIGWSGWWVVLGILLAEYE